MCKDYNFTEYKMMDEKAKEEIDDLLIEKKVRLVDNIVIFV